jgi:hypothetical protein
MEQSERGYEGYTKETMSSDKEFYLSLFPEDGPSTCKHENCKSKAVSLSVMCAKHHFEMVMKKPCPFTYEDMEIAKKSAYGSVGKLIMHSVTASMRKMGGCIAMVLFMMLFSISLTLLGYPKDAWLEGNWVASGIHGGILASSCIVCYFLHKILFGDAGRRGSMRFSDGWASIIISIGMAGMGIGWIIAAKIQWPQLTAVSNITLTSIFGTLIGLVIGLSIGLGIHETLQKATINE